MKNTTAQINDHLFYEMPLRQTEVGMVLGCQSVSGTAALLTAKLYHEGLFPKIVVSGGAQTGSRVEMAGVMAHRFRAGKLREFFETSVGEDFLSKKKESEYMLDVLQENGVPKSAIVCVDYSATNAQQNFESCMMAMSRFNSASLITYAPYQRRTLGTARQNPNYNHMALQTVPVYPFGIDASNWDSWPIKGFVKAEFDKIDPNNPKSYIGKFCVNPDIAQEIARFDRDEGEKIAASL